MPPKRAIHAQDARAPLREDERERRIAESYSRAYTEHPEEPELGDIGAKLMAEAIADLKRGDR